MSPASRRISPALIHGLLGAAFGVVLVVGGTALDLWVRGRPLSRAAMLDAQAAQPLLWMLDAAPLVLGLVAAAIGAARDGGAGPGARNGGSQGPHVVGPQGEAPSLGDEPVGAGADLHGSEGREPKHLSGRTRQPRAMLASPVRTRRRRRLLLAEDNEVSRMLTVSLLRKRGFDVTVATNGREAVEWVSRREFDLVLMDVAMPEMDGFHATAQIRAMEQAGNRRIPIVAVTAHAMEGDHERCIIAGMDDYVSKPVDPDELDAAITRWTGDLPDFELTRALDLAEGDEGLLGSIVKLFLEQSPERLEAIHQALDAGDALQVEEGAHSLEGAAMRLAMPRLRDIACRIAALSAEGELEQAAELMVELEEAVGSGTTAVKGVIDVA